MRVPAHTMPLLACWPSTLLIILSISGMSSVRCMSTSQRWSGSINDEVTARYRKTNREM